jgi:hypothetical protein
MPAIMPLPGVGGTLFSGGSGGVAQGSMSPGSTATPSLGKNSVIQNLDSPHSGLRSTITKGDPLSRLMGQYGKGHGLATMAGGHSKAPNAPSVSQANPTLHQLRGGLGQMRRIRGGLGPGKVGQPGPSNKDYSMTSPDLE